MAAEYLRDKVVTPAQFELFGHDAKGAVGGNEVDRLHPRVVLDGKQQMAQEYRAAGARSGDGQVLRRLGQLRPRGSIEHRNREAVSQGEHEAQN